MKSKNTAWRDFLGDKQELLIAVISVIVFLVTITSYTTFLTSVELRQGVVFIDPVHEMIGPIDLTWPIFIALYGALIAAIVSLLGDPSLFFRALRAYTLLIGVRIIAMWTLPLDPPVDMIPLSDPIVEMFASDGSATLTRDLFFSGHTATLTLIALLVPQRALQWTFFGLAILVGAAVIIQHVHYTVDVVVAPFIALGAAIGSGIRKGA